MYKWNIKIKLYLWSSPINILEICGAIIPTKAIIPIKLTTADVIKVTIIPEMNLNFFTSSPKEVAESSPLNNKL